MEAASEVARLGAAASASGGLHRGESSGASAFSADELQFLKRVLRESEDRGQRVDQAVLRIRLKNHAPKRGRALTVEQLYELASWFPEHTSRLVLVAGQVGARQSFWFGLTDDMLDLDSGTMAIPAELAKNRREHRVYLTSVEVSLLREQLLARAPRTNLVFPTPEGGQWDRSRFGDRVWRKSVAAAARHDREPLDGAVSVFDGFHVPLAAAHRWIAHGSGWL